MEAPVSTVNLSFLQPASEVTSAPSPWWWTCTDGWDFPKHYSCFVFFFFFLGWQVQSRCFFIPSIYQSSESTRVKGLSQGGETVLWCLSTGYGEAVTSGRRRVFSKDLLFQVGLVQWKVIHSSTLEANEKAPQDVVQRGSEWRNTHQFKTCGPGALRGKH